MHLWYTQCLILINICFIPYICLCQISQIQTCLCVVGRPGYVSTSPASYITTVSNTLYNRTSWTTQHALSSDHIPIITAINIRHDYRLQQNRRTFTNYNKADWTQFTEVTESAFSQTTIPTNIHTANRIFTNIILMADKHNIPKGKMHNNPKT